MFERLRLFNEIVGRATLEDIYAMTPREFDTIVAGGMQRSYNLMLDMRFSLKTSVVPSVMIEPDKFDNGEIKKLLNDREQAIKSLTDKKIQKQIDQQNKQQKRFMDIFMKGGKSE